MYRPWIIAFTVIGAVVIAAMCAWFVMRPAVAATTPPDAMRVVVTRMVYSQGDEQSATIVFNQAFSTAPAQRIYTALRADPNITGQVQSCPSIAAQAPYYHYVLTFTRQNSVVGTATSDAYGCEDIVFVANGIQTDYSWYNNGTSFWDVLHQVTNAPEPLFGE